MASESYGAVVPNRWDPSVRIPAPRAQVFAYLADPRHRTEWQAGLARVQMVDEGEPRVGMRWVDHLAGGLAFDLQIIGMEPDRMWAEVTRKGPFTAFMTLLFEDDTVEGTPGTCVRIVPRVRGRRLARPLGAAGTALMNALVRFDLPRIARAAQRG
jgi:uncharacterized protein YndB with AHSA1/START domain